MEKTSPAEAINLLKEYHQKVTLLVLNCETLIKHNKVDKDMLPIFDSNVKAVKEFYNQ